MPEMHTARWITVGRWRIPVPFSIVHLPLFIQEDRHPYLGAAWDGSAGFLKVHHHQYHTFTHHRHHHQNPIHPITSHAFVSLLKACTSSRDLERGLDVYSEISRFHCLQDDVFLGTALVDMYAKCGSLIRAQEVFDKLPVRNVVTWNALLTGCVDSGCGEEALDYFEEMHLEGILPNAVTFVCILKACGVAQSLSLGEVIHVEIMKQNLLERDVILGNALIDMYVKCSMLERAQEAHDKLPRRNVISWSTFISGYAQHGFGDKALDCWRKMKDEGLSPNATTFIFVLKACGSTGS